MVSSSGSSHAGPVRAINEDRLLADDALSLFVVADGMGGHAAGEVASREAVETLAGFIRQSCDPQDPSWPCRVDEGLTVDGNRVRAAIHLANRRLRQLAESDDDYHGMGSTIVCALITGNRLVIGHAGDSRLYLLSNGELTQQTRDDTWAATVLKSIGEGDGPEAIARHPMRHVLTNALGVRDQVEAHVAERELHDGDMLLLCSDGVHNVLDDSALAGLLTADAALETKAQAVIEAAIAGGTRDNVTALVVRYTADGSTDA